MIAPTGHVAELAVFVVLALALGLFILDHWRYDVVALLAALVLSVIGVIPPERLFVGFGHPAVITVAAVLVVSHGLQNSGLVQLLAGWLLRVGKRPTTQVASLSGFAGGASAFMNNVGALALFLPVGVKLARRSGVAPSVLLMPLAFASLLGGMVTLIGTPPNIIIATFRDVEMGSSFGMFDFTPVGLGVAVAGIAFISLVGWRLLPTRKGAGDDEDLFRIHDYMTEVRVPEDSALVGTPVGEVAGLVEGEVTVVALVSGERSVPAPAAYRRLAEGDVLLLRAESEALEELVDGKRLELVGEGGLEPEVLSSDEISLVEVVVRPDASILGSSPRSLRFRLREGVNVLAVAREGARLSGRLAEISFRSGDVLLLQLRSEEMSETLEQMGCLPLAQRGLSVGKPRRVALALLLFGAALGLATAGLLSVTVALSLAAVAMVLVRLVPTREIYESVDWPVVVLLGAMIPVGEALETTGGASRIADWILWSGELFPPAAALTIVLVGSMFLSDLVNNAAAVVLMAPVALTVAAELGAAPDPFLMAVAVGGSSAFLTPIGHQSNILVMRPAGYRFGDYWRMGLPLEVVTVGVAVPLILYFWPL